MYIEAMLFAIDRINRNKKILYGNKLDARIFDSCGQRSRLRNNLVFTANYGPQGVIGPQYSDDAMAAAIVLDIFGKSVISYSATSPDLDDRGKYGQLYRTVPSDDKQVQVMIDIALKFNWTYVAFIHSHGSYGERAASLFKTKVEKAGICVPVLFTMPKDADINDFNFALNSIFKKPQVKVVFLFLTDVDATGFFEAAENMEGKTKYLTFVGSDGWGNRNSVVEGKEKVVDGSLSMKPHSDDVKEFKDYFLALRPENNKRNIWFTEYWEDVFNCSLNNNTKPSYKKICSGNETLESGLGYYDKTPVLTVINGVYAYAYVFRKVLEEQCLNKNLSSKYCVNKPHYVLRGITNWRDIRYKLKRIRFKEPFRNRTFLFDKSGVTQDDYDLLNFRRIGNSEEYKYVKIGQWVNNEKVVYITKSSTVSVRDYLKHKYTSTGKLHFTRDDIFWRTGNSTAPVSVCSIQCERGKIAVHKSSSKCCWDCKRCDLNDVIFNNTCISCGLGSVPDPLLTKCLPLPVKYLSFSNPVAASIFCITCLGLLFTLATTILFVKNFNHRVVKASGRELCLNMLLGILVTYLGPVLYILEPSYSICSVQRFMITMGFTICYAPLLLKLNRIYRIFRNAKTTVIRPIMVNPKSQILMSLGLSAVGVLLGVASFKGDPPKITKRYPSHRGYVIKQCALNTFTLAINISYSSVLMVASTWYAFKTRNFPKNYNETKIIGFTMYMTCLVLSVALPAFFFIIDTEGNKRVFIMCFVCEAIATINLIGLFGPKVVKLLKPNSSNHIGNTSLRTNDDFETNISMRRVTVKTDANESPKPEKLTIKLPVDERRASQSE